MLLLTYMIKSKFLCILLNIFSTNATVYNIDESNINYDNINKNNKNYVPLTLEYYNKINKKLTEKEKKMLIAYNLYINLLNYNNAYITNTEKDRDEYLFYSWNDLNNTNLYGNMLASFIFFLIGNLLGIVIINYGNDKEINIDNTLTILKNDYILYTIFTFANMICFSHSYFFNLEFKKIYLVYVFVLTLLSLLFIKIIDWIWNSKKTHDMDNNKFRIFALSEFIFIIQYLCYWRFFIYKKNKDYFNKNIKPKFNEINKSVISKEYRIFNDLTKCEHVKYITYIEENKEGDFNKNILSL